MKLTDKKLSIKAVLIITVVLPVFVIIISSIAIVMTASSVQPQATLDPSLLNKTNLTLPKTKEEALSAFEKYVENAVNSKRVRYVKNTSVNIDGITCGNENVQEIFDFAKNSFAQKLGEDLTEITVRYGEDASALLSVLPGSIPDEFDAALEDGSFTLTLTYTKAFSNMYFTGSDTAAIRLFNKENDTVFSSLNEKLIPGTVHYTVSCDELTGEISSLSVDRSYAYSSHIAFKNTLSSIGNTDLSMTVSFSEDYKISFAGIEIEEDIMTLSENGYDTLTIIPYVEEGLSADEYSLSFTSSDESVAVIDENGQVTAIKEHNEPITVTVNLNYLGKDFSDTCLIYVVKEVESVTVSDTKLSLNVGETYTLTAEIKPDDASVKTVCFVSDNEDAVTVSENGKITAASPGTATVYAYSEQGFIAAACVVTVNT